MLQNISFLEKFGQSALSLSELFVTPRRSARNIYNQEMTASSLASVIATVFVTNFLSASVIALNENQINFANLATISTSWMIIIVMVWLMTGAAQVALYRLILDWVEVYPRNVFNLLIYIKCGTYNPSVIISCLASSLANDADRLSTFYIIYILSRVILVALMWPIWTSVTGARLVVRLSFLIVEIVLVIIVNFIPIVAAVLLTDGGLIMMLP